MPSIYVDKNMEIVDAGDTRAARLAWREGSAVDEQRLEAMKPGLAKAVKDRIKASKDDPKPAEEEAQPEPEPEAKEAEGPVEDKAVEKVQNKASARKSKKD